MKLSFLRPRWTRKRREDGAVAIMFAVLAVVLIVLAAFAVNIADQVNTKQKLQDRLDGAAQAAAYNLPGGDLCAAVNDARRFFTDGAYTGATCADPYNTTTYGKMYVDFWCVVGRDDVQANVANVTHIPTTCNPDGYGTYINAPIGGATTGNDSPYTTAKYAGRQCQVGQGATAVTCNMTCNDQLCAIPCGLLATPGNSFNPDPGLSDSRPDNTKPIACNSIRVMASQDVPFSFSQVTGISTGKTGALASLACVGACGNVTTTPINLVVVTDRTGSMDPADVVSMRNGLKDLLAKMNPRFHIVSFGTISRSQGGGTTTTGTPSTSYPNCPSYGTGDSIAGNWLVPGGTGNWSAGYLNASGTLNNGDPITNAVNCFTYAGNARNTKEYSGTWLPAPFKAAARQLKFPGALPSAASGRYSDPTNVLIFETDGEPNQNLSSGATAPIGTVNINNNDGDPFVPNDHYTTSSTSGQATTPGAISMSNNGDACSTPVNAANGIGQYANSVSYTTAGAVTAQSSSTALTVYYCYSNQTNTTVTTNTNARLYDGGQLACSQFSTLAAQAKSQIPNLVVAVVGFRLGQGVHNCGSSNQFNPGNNTQPGSTTNGNYGAAGAETCFKWRKGATVTLNCTNPALVTAGAPFPSAVSGGDVTKRSTLMTSLGCTTGNKCTIWYTRTVSRSATRTDTVTSSVDATDQPILDVLQSAATPRPDAAATGSNCSDDAAIQANNTDGDWFFCGSSTNISTLFGNILQQVATGVKLLSQP